eukprot:2506462-Rhodomonas_salina.1
MEEEVQTRAIDTVGGGASVGAQLHGSNRGSAGVGRERDGMWFNGKGSMNRMIKDAGEKGNRQLASRDLDSGKGTKTFASFPGSEEFCTYVLSCPPQSRHLYELIAPGTRVRLWLDIEFLSPSESDGETRRKHLERILTRVVRASFSVDCPLFFWGKSSRWDKKNNTYKHSYQLRVPNVTFPCNTKDSLLAAWVNKFVQMTSYDPLMLCPHSKKHIIDTVVYSRFRSVRTCFSCKKNDSTCTALMFMQNTGNADVVEGERAEFFALLVDAGKKYDGYGGVDIQHGDDVKLDGLPGVELPYSVTTRMVNAAAGRVDGTRNTGRKHSLDVDEQQYGASGTSAVKKRRAVLGGGGAVA